MLSKVRSTRGGTCVVIGALVCLSLLLPTFYTGTSLSRNVLLDWLEWSKPTVYVSDEFPQDHGLRGLRPKLDATKLCNSVKLRVYAYDFPRKFNFGLMQKNSAPDQELPWDENEPLPTWPQRSGLKKQHSVEYWLMMDLLHSTDGEKGVVRVMRPEEADLFFVPFFSSLSFNRHGQFMRDPEAEKDRILQEEVASFIFNSKWWQRSGGVDHVITVHHPNAFRFYKDMLNASIFIVADFGRSSLDISSLKKDVVAPYAHVVPTFIDDIGEDPFESRTTLLFFKEGLNAKMYEFRWYCENAISFAATKQHGVHFEEGIASTEGLEEASVGMRKSRYCLHPAGDTPSSCRLFDAIVSHCVPVIVSDRIELPFEDDLNYSSFALFFSVEEALQPGWLLKQLRNVEKDRWLQMFLKLKEVSKHFEFQHPSKQDDAVNMIWKQMQRKVPAIRLAMHRKQRLRVSDWWR